MNFEFEDHLYEFASVVDQAFQQQFESGGASSKEMRLTRATTLSNELGVLSLSVPQELGGSGVSAHECSLVIETLGRHLVAGPIADFVATIAPTLASVSSDEGKELLRACATGAATISVQDGWSVSTAWNELTDYVAVVTSESVEIVSSTDLRADALDSAGLERRGTTDSVPVILRLGKESRDEMRARAVIGSALQLSGVAGELIHRAAAYATNRVQFGVPIGSFQGVKHQLADAFSAVELSRRLAWWASWRIDQRQDDWIEGASLAKYMIGEAALKASYAALQVHGAIGFTTEVPLHHWLTNVQDLGAAWGTSDEHFEEICRRQQRTNCDA